MPCGKDGPGRVIHRIRAKTSREYGQPIVTVKAVAVHDGRIEIDGDKLELALWRHDPGMPAVGARCSRGLEAEIPSARSNLKRLMQPYPAGAGGVVPKPGFRAVLRRLHSPHPKLRREATDAAGRRGQSGVRTGTARRKEGVS